MDKTENTFKMLLAILTLQIIRIAIIMTKKNVFICKLLKMRSQFFSCANFYTHMYDILSHTLVLFFC